MRTVLFPLLLLPALLFSQSPLTPLQTSRLYTAGKLWGEVKYFHPWLAYKNINWDSAFVAAAPKILEAKSNEEYAAVLQEMLSALGDDASFVSLRGKTSATPTFTNIERGKAYLQDSVLIMRLNDKAIADDWNEAAAVTASAVSLLPKAKAAVFDLRITQSGSHLRNSDEMNYEFNYSPNGGTTLNQALAAGTTELPSERMLLHEGFRSEGASSDEYRSSFKIGHANTVNGLRKTPLFCVFLLNKNAAVPGIALVLQRQGLAAIISEGGDIEPLTASTFRYKADSLDVSIRKGDAVDAEGLLQPTTDSVLAEHTDYNINLQTAVSMAKRAKPSTRSSSARSRYNGVWMADGYAKEKFPDLGNRLLAAAKMYTVVRFFFPNKDLMDENWDSVYRRYLPQYVSAADQVSYCKAVAGMFAHIQDSHGFAWSAHNPIYRSMLGSGGWPSVILGRVGSQLVVRMILNDSAAKAEGLEKGDVIRKLNGADPMILLKQLRQYYPASNDDAADRNLTVYLLIGNDSTTVPLTVQKRNGSLKQVTVSRSKNYSWQQRYPSASPFKKDMPLCAVLSGNIGYIDLQQLEVDNVDSVMNAMRQTKALIFDDRTYPPSVTQDLFAYLPLPNGKQGGLRQPVVDADAVVVGDADFVKEGSALLRDVEQSKPRKWQYAGKTVVLFNEYTQSFAEGMASRFIASGAVGIGRHTAGANGDITSFNLPGGINLSFSGRKPVNADGTSPQRVGIQPTIKVEPTVKGIQAGRDEVLERAVLYLQTGK